ncbi:MAG: sugar phosphate isomerase/epimerase family protein [Rhodothermales bacterium]
MPLSRRHFLRTTGSALAAAGILRPEFRPLFAAGRIGMCDWNLGRSCDPEDIPRAAAAGLAGVQVSVGTRPDFMPLRLAAVRERYLDLGKEHGIAFPSVAAGNILNRIPLKSEPQSAVYVIDAVEAAAALGSSCILVAFFGNGDLRLRDGMGAFRDLGTEGFSTYELDAAGVTRVVEALRQIAPRAEDAGVILGLENTLTAMQNLEILDRVGSPMVQVYYDVGNSTAYGYDVPTELRLLGSARICEIHIKETLGLDDPMTPVLGGPASRGVDFAGVAAACRDIEYDRWFILETSGRDGRFQEDTRANVGFIANRLT